MASGRLVAVIGAGIGLTALYAAAATRLALARYFPGPGASLAFTHMLGPDWRWASVQYAAAVVLACALYGVALAAVWPGRRPLPAALLYGFPALFAVALLWMYPPTAVDMFHYQADARTLWVHGDNPLTVPPSAHPYPIRISWQHQPSPYGPFWSLLTFGPALLPGDDYLAGLVLFKALAAAFYLGCARLVYRLTARLRPGRESAAVLLFAWNPFVVLRTVGNGHNDLVMMFFALLALDLARRRVWLAVFPLLALSVLVKYATALLGPLVLWYAWSQTPGTARDRLRALAPGLAAAVLLTVVCYAPFWAGRATFATGMGEANTKMITSTPLLLKAQLELSTGLPDPAAAARALSRLLFLGLYLPLVWQARRDFTRLVTCSFTALFLYLVASVWFRPWYMLWPLTLAALLPGTWFTPLLLAISCCASFPDLVEQYGRNWRWLRADPGRTLAAPIVVAFLPPLLVWLAGLAAFRSWHFDPSWWLRGKLAGRPCAPPPSGMPAPARYLVQCGEKVSTRCVLGCQRSRFSRSGSRLRRSAGRRSWMPPAPPAITGPRPAAARVNAPPAPASWSEGCITSRPWAATKASTSSASAAANPSRRRSGSAARRGSTATSQCASRVSGPGEGGPRHALRHHGALHRGEGCLLRGRLPGELHLRGRGPVLYQP